MCVVLPLVKQSCVFCIQKGRNYDEWRHDRQHHISIAGCGTESGTRTHTAVMAKGF